MKFSRKTISASIALVLTLTIAATLLTLPTVTAHDPAWEIPSWTFISTYPDPIGIGQPIFIVFWVDMYPQTAGGAYGDRYTFTVEVTKPDNSKQTLGPITSDPVGTGYYVYTPDQIGTYSFVANFPGLTYTGEPANPYDTRPRGGAYIGDHILPSTSEPDTVTVQQDQLEQLPWSELPTDYWTRPVDSSLRTWSEIAGNWLNTGKDNLYTTGPETAHIVWTKPQYIGGLTGGEYGHIGYYEGSSYERQWQPKSIIQGRLYYRVGRSDQPQTLGTMCVDLRTGEELLFMNRTSITNGMIYNYESPNQHGTIPYLYASGNVALFEVGPTTPAYSFYDPWTGEWLWTITDRPSGTSAIGPSGEALIYTVNTNGGWMSLWNSTKPLDLLGSTSGTGLWQWRPVGKTVDSTDAYEWNVTLPDGLEGSLKTVLSDRLIGGSGYANYGSKVYHGEFSLWAVSIEPGHEGELIFNKKITAPPEGPAQNMTMQFEGDRVSEELGVILLKAKETRSWYGFDYNTGDLLWGPTAPADQFMMFDRAANIYGDKFYFDGYAGLYCYDLKTGEHLWTWTPDKCELEGPYEYWPIAGVTFADGKVYLTTGEHSHTQPLYRGWSGYCIDAETGQGIWNITGVWGTQVLADGYLVSLNGMDNQIYCFGKGQTATTISATPSVITDGTSVILQGTVTDQSPGAKDTPAIADDDMTAWMEYLYKQHSMPTNAKGVQVTLDAIDPNGNYVSIGKTTSDISGFYSLMWEPEHEGKYVIIATFEGSDSYYASYAETAIGVTEAASPAQSMEPEPTEPTETAFITTEIAIIAAVIVASIIGIAAYWVIRKRK